MMAAIGKMFSGIGRGIQAVYRFCAARFRLDDLLIVTFLVLTVWHSAHVLSAFELPGWEWLAWFLALGIDVGIARASWVANNRALPGGARIVASLWLVFLLANSFGLNIAFYSERQQSFWMFCLASTFPVSLAATGGIKAFLLSRSDATDKHPVTAQQPNRDELAMLKQQLADMQTLLVSTQQQQQPISSQPTYVYHQQPVASEAPAPLFATANSTGPATAKPGRPAKRPTSINSKASAAKPKSLNVARVLNATEITPDMLVLTGPELGGLSKHHPAKYAEYVAVRATAQVAS